MRTSWKLLILALSLAAALPGCDGRSPLEPADGTTPLPEASASRLVRVQVPEQATVPLYGRMTWSDEWAALFLYRPEDCVDDGFDLAEPDPAAIGSGAVFDCPLPPRTLTIQGFFLIEDGALAPKQANFHNVRPMPVWFVSRSAFDAARSGDGKITREEMEGASSFLRGTADHYHITLHPAPVPGLPGGHPVVSMKIEARGLLDDGRPFRVSVSIVYPRGSDQPFVGPVSIDIG